jgi:hypothetical protein
MSRHSSASHSSGLKPVAAAKMAIAPVVGLSSSATASTFAQDSNGRISPLGGTRRAGSTDRRSR